MATTFFRIFGDWLHTIAVLMILHRLFVMKNAQGISRKTQELCLLTSLFRYLDLLTTFYSPYNSLMKVFYIWSATASIYIMSEACSKHVISKTYRSHEDRVPHWTMILLPCLVLGFATHVRYGGGGAGAAQQPQSNFNYYDYLDNGMEYLWTVSLYLEATSCIPQIYVFRKYRQVESLTGGGFIFLMGIYRGCYVLNYMVRYHTEIGYQIHWALRLTSIAQFLICMGGLFWPVQKGETSETSAAVAAPLLPQLLQFGREIATAKTGVALSGTACLMLGGIFQGRESSRCEVCFILLASMTLLCTGFVIQMWRIGDLEKRRDQICALLCSIILWSVLVGVPFVFIMFLVLMSCLVVCCSAPRTHSDDADEDSTLPLTEIGFGPSGEDGTTSSILVV